VKHCPVASGEADLVYIAQIGIVDLSGNETMTYEITYTNGLTDIGSIAAGDLGLDGVYNFVAPDGTFIDSISLTAGENTKTGLNGLKTFVIDDTKTVDLDFSFAATDADGDVVTGDFSLTAQNSTELIGDGDNNALAGGGGDDILIGGEGNDILTGGDGADIFRWLAGDEGPEGSSDLVTDFSISDGDVLDLSALLGSPAEDGATLDSFLNFAQVGADTVISVDVNGDGGGTDMTITLADFDSASLGVDNATIIQSLIDSGSLNTSDS
jgi:Ca2+-binding RTX toxin-like protein